MIKFVPIKSARLAQTNQHNIYLAINDWLIMGLQSDFRRRIWTQHKTYINKHKDIQRNVDGSVAAFLTDKEFRSKNSKRIKKNSDKEIAKSNIVNIKWRSQKNNDND